MLIQNVWSFELETNDPEQNVEDENIDRDDTSEVDINSSEES